MIIYDFVSEFGFKLIFGGICCLGISLMMQAFCELFK